MAYYDLGRIRYGDFNGDKMTDILLIDFANSASYIYWATGDKFYPFSAAVPGPNLGTSVMNSVPYLLNDLARIKIGDFNGDEKTDLLQLNDRNTTAPLRIFLSRGNGFTMKTTVNASNQPFPFYIDGSFYTIPICVCFASLLILLKTKSFTSTIF